MNRAGTRPIGIVSTGVANTASVVAACQRFGGEPFLITRPDQVISAEKLILPGVGSFAVAMQTLRRMNLVQPLQERISSGRSTLAICLGLQLLAAESAESPGAEGLGLIPLAVQRLRAERVPQLGWNRVQAAGDSRWVESGYAYYANSFALTTAPEGWRTSWSLHGSPLVAALERDSVLACQFHPELSGAWGARLLRRWWEGSI